MSTKPRIADADGVAEMVRKRCLKVRPLIEALGINQDDHATGLLQCLEHYSELSIAVKKYLQHNDRAEHCNRTFCENEESLDGPDRYDGARTENDERLLAEMDRLAEEEIRESGLARKWRARVEELTGSVQQ